MPVCARLGPGEATRNPRSTSDSQDGVPLLFGKGSGSKNKDRSSVVPPPDPGVEEEGFTVLGTPSRQRQQQQPPLYPGLGDSPGSALPPQSSFSALAPQQQDQSSSPGYSTSTLASQSSLTAPHALDGVPFVLSGRCWGADTTRRHREMSDYLEKTDRYLEGVQELIRSSAGMDFRLEKNVVQSDITATMRRMHMNSFG